MAAGKVFPSGRWEVLPLEAAENLHGVGDQLVEVFRRHRQGESGDQAGEEDFTELVHGWVPFIKRFGSASRPRPAPARRKSVG